MPDDPRSRGPYDRVRQEIERGHRKSEEHQEENQEKARDEQSKENSEKKPQDKARRDHPPGNPAFQ